MNRGDRLHFQAMAANEVTPMEEKMPPSGRHGQVCPDRIGYGYSQQTVQDSGRYSECSPIDRLTVGRHWRVAVGKETDTPDWTTSVRAISP
jgi:hypothetical protein